MNAKQKMAYHAREYRRLKSLLVGDAVNIPHLEKMTRDYENHAKQLQDSFIKIYNAKMKLSWEAHKHLSEIRQEIKSSQDEKTKQSLIEIYNRLAATRDFAKRLK